MRLLSLFDFKNRCSGKNDEGHTNDRHGQWRCAVCTKKWQQSTSAHLRLFCIGDATTEYFLVKCGELSQAQENTINILKACKLLEQLDGVKITVLSLLDAICELNTKCETRLGSYKEANMFTAVDPSEYATIYCEDHRLSLCRVGQTFKALKIDPSAVPVCAAEDVDMILATANAFVNIEEYPATGAGTKKTKNVLVAKALTIRAAWRAIHNIAF